MWILQSPDITAKNRSMYYSHLVADDNGEEIAVFTLQIDSAKKFEKAADAKQFIKETGLDHCHVIPY